jgi:hypothetical protein
LSSIENVVQTFERPLLKIIGLTAPQPRKCESRVKSAI